MIMVVQTRKGGLHGIAQSSIIAGNHGKEERDEVCEGETEMGSERDKESERSK